MKILLVSGLVLISLCLAGCSTQLDSVSNVYTGPDQTLSSVPVIVQQDATVVGKAYGDPYPKVAKVVYGATVDNSTDMYRATINGNFVRKDIKYKTILFSMLADGSKIFSIGNSNDVSKLTFDDETLPR